MVRRFGFLGKDNQFFPSFFRIFESFPSLHDFLDLIVELPTGLHPQGNGFGKLGNINLTAGACQDKDIKRFINGESQPVKDGTCRYGFLIVTFCTPPHHGDFIFSILMIATFLTGISISPL